jgi:hypothetical protein
VKRILIIAIYFLFSISFVDAQHAKPPFIDWHNLKNPVYSHPGWSTKDACMVYDHGFFYLYFSAFFFDEGRERSHIAAVRTKDFKSCSEPLFVWNGVEQGWIGLCSPDIRKIGDEWFLTFNSWGDKKGEPNQLFYATSKDLSSWSSMKPLAKNITDGVRAIDAAIFPFNNKIYLVWKRGQEPVVSVGDSLNSNNWRNIGRPIEPWFENGQFFESDGKINLLVTTREHLPAIAGMSGSGLADSCWLNWENLRPLEIIGEEFNTNEKANAASIIDWRSYDGYFYLIYAGRTEGESHEHRGNNKLALARSKDLVQWELPGK